PGSRVARVHQHRHVDRLLLHLATVHDHPHVRRARAHPGFLRRGRFGPGRPRMEDGPRRDRPAGAARHRRRVDLHVLADPGRLHHSDPGRRSRVELHRQRRLLERRRGRERPLRRGVRHDPRRHHGALPADGEAPGRVRGAVAMGGRWTRWGLRLWVFLVLAFLFVPIVLILVYAFNTSNIESWPIPGWTTHWFRVTWRDPQVRSSLLLSVKAGLLSTGVALVLGSIAAFGVHRFRFFGREAISFLFVLPLALPGIITGMALNAFFRFNGVTFSLMTIVVGHATFCIVIVYNNLL